jgi:hypothetical protein
MYVIVYCWWLKAEVMNGTLNDSNVLVDCDHCVCVNEALRLSTMMLFFPVQTEGIWGEKQKIRWIVCRGWRIIVRRVCEAENMCDQWSN